MDQKALGQDPCPWEGSVRKRSLQVWTLALGSEWVELQPAHPSSGILHRTDTYPTGKPTGAHGVLEKPPLHSQGVCSAACQPRGLAGSEQCGVPTARAARAMPGAASLLCLPTQVRLTPHHAWGEIMVKTRSSYAETD